MVSGIGICSRHRQVGHHKRATRSIPRVAAKAVCLNCWWTGIFCVLSFRRQRSSRGSQPDDTQISQKMAHEQAVSGLVQFVNPDTSVLQHKESYHALNLPAA